MCSFGLYTAWTPRAKKVAIIEECPDNSGKLQKSPPGRPRRATIRCGMTQIRPVQRQANRRPVGALHIDEPMPFPPRSQPNQPQRLPTEWVDWHRYCYPLLAFCGRGNRVMIRTSRDCAAT